MTAFYFHFLGKFRNRNVIVYAKCICVCQRIFLLEEHFSFSNKNTECMRKRISKKYLCVWKAFAYFTIFRGTFIRKKKNLCRFWTINWISRYYLKLGFISKSQEQLNIHIHPLKYGIFSRYFFPKNKYAFLMKCYSPGEKMHEALQ